MGPLPIQAEGALGTSSPQPCHLAYYQAPSSVVALTEGEWLLGACYPELVWGLGAAKILPVCSGPAEWPLSHT